MATEFMAAKNQTYANEDPKVLNSLSDVFDMRNWFLDVFDPSNHESLSIEKTNDFKLDGKSSRTIRNGYSIENSIIRPAQVILSSYIKKNS